MPEENQGLGQQQPNNPQPQAPQTPPQEPGQQAPQTVEVPGVGQLSVDEVIKGYQRQSDYTRKTQDVARQREEVEQAQEFLQSLEEDPVTAIKALGEAYEVDWKTYLGEEPSEPQGGNEPSGGEDEIPPALQERLKRYDEVIDRFEEQSLRNRIDNEIRDVRETYGEFPVGDVLNYGLKRGIADVESAYKAWAYDQQLEKQRGGPSAGERSEASVFGGEESTQTGDVGNVESFEDAFEQSLKDLQGG